MCGIAGIVSKGNEFNLKDAIFQMSHSIKHRGPDGEGFLFIEKNKAIPAFSNETPIINKQSNAYLFNPSVSIQEFDGNSEVALAHRRLSIIDLSETGHQPMCDNSGNYWITFNGEIYNYVELKKELEQLGHTFVTKTDTEVLIEAYKAWGINCLKKFNGMFAFVLFDKKNNHLFCARDRVGVKPFYYINNNKVFAFASEYKAFVKSNLIPFEINEQQQFEFLTDATLETNEESLFKGIKELKPAHYFVYNLASHQLVINKYYSLPEVSHFEKSDKELIELIEEKIIQSVSLRLRSDVAIGSCLSGGLDSSVIAGVIKHLQPNNELKLFTATFPHEKFDESNYAKLVAEKLKANWNTVTPTADDFFKEIAQLNYFQDLPVWTTSTYSQHRVMQLTHENNIKVVLDGQGADEVFAGYSHHYVALWKEQFSFKKLNDSRYTISKPYQLFAKQLLKEKLHLRTDYANVFNQFSDAKTLHYKIPNNLNVALAEDYNGRLKSFLKCEDRCSMAFGIESRVPFADDVELVNLLFKVAGDRKMQHGISKYLLREATKHFIPQEIYNRRDKIGFETPVENWLFPYKSIVIDTINKQLSFVNKDYLAKNFDKMLSNKPQFLFRLYSFAVWKQVFSNI